MVYEGCLFFFSFRKTEGVSAFVLITQACYELFFHHFFFKGETSLHVFLIAYLYDEGSPLIQWVNIWVEITDPAAG